MRLDEPEHLRLRLGGVVAQGDAIALDLVEALFAEVIPVKDRDRPQDEPEKRNEGRVYGQRDQRPNAPPDARRHRAASRICESEPAYHPLSGFFQRENVLQTLKTLCSLDRNLSKPWERGSILAVGRGGRGSGRGGFDTPSCDRSSICNPLRFRPV